MRINELIEELEKVREEHGNLEVGRRIYPYQYIDIEEVVVVSNKRKTTPNNEPKIVGLQD